MMQSIAAEYFDGQSSAVQHTTVTLSDTLCRWQTVGGTCVTWNLCDLDWEQYGDLLEIRNKQDAGIVLKIRDTAFIPVFYQAVKQNNGVDIHTRLLRIGFPKIAGIALCLFVLLVLTYIYALPPLAEKTAQLLPADFDNYIGSVFMDSFLAEHEINTAKTRTLKQFAAELDLKNTKPLTFYVVESDEVNAFALPNGHIVVFTALLDTLNSPDELAALLGHEVSHVNYRHSTKMLCRTLAGYILVSFILSDVNGIMAVLADNARQLHSLSYSRAFEQEADEQGLAILIDNNINPNGMLDLFEQLEEEHRIAIPKILSTHPLTHTRKTTIEKRIQQLEYHITQHPKLQTYFDKLKNTAPKPSE